MTPFARLALLAGTSLYALGLALIGRYLGWGVAVGVAVLGAALALVVTLELTHPVQSDASGSGPSSEGGKSEAEARGTVRGRDRTEIERSARRAREE